MKLLLPDKAIVNKEKVTSSARSVHFLPLIGRVDVLVRDQGRNGPYRAGAGLRGATACGSRLRRSLSELYPR